MEHEAGVEPACFGFKAQRGCRQPTARVLDQAAGIEPAWARVQSSAGVPVNPHLNGLGRPPPNRTEPARFWRPTPPSGRPEVAGWPSAGSKCPIRIRAAFQTGSAPGRFAIQNGGRRDTRKPCPKAPTGFEPAAAPWRLHLPELVEAERVERSRPLRIFTGFRPDERATCEPLAGIGGERTIRRPYRFRYPAISNRVRRPGRFTLQIGPACHELHGRHSRKKRGLR